VPASVPWVTGPAEPVLAQLESGVNERSGAALIGPAGVGKSWLLRRAVERLGAEFPRVDWVHATSARSTIPFAAVEHLVAVPETGTAAAALCAARQTLGDGRLLVVDDAHLLDPLSATLIYQLAVGATVRLLVAAGMSVAPAPAEVTALWQDGLLARIDLHPPGHDDARLMAHVADMVDALAPGPRRVLEFLSVCDPLSLEDLAALTSAHDVEDATQAGMVAVDEDGARAAHPLFCTAVRKALGGPELRRLRTALVGRLASAGPRGVVARLRLASLAVGSDQPPPADEVCAAARDALRLGDLDLCERLGRAALEYDPGLEARLTVGYALAWQGRGRDADEMLSAIDPAALSEDELMAWALPTAANQFWMLSQPERATAFLQGTRAKVGSAAARTTLDALSATFAMNAGNLGKAVDLADRVLTSADADDTAVGWAGSAAALCAARSGRFDDVDALAARALSAAQPGLLRFTSGFGQTTALVLTGEPRRALALARRLTDFAQRRQPGRAIGEVLIADVLISMGQPGLAAALLREAAATLTPTGYSWGPLAWMLLAQALGRLGKPVEAGKALTRAESRHGLKSMLFAPELALARAWALSAGRDTHGAVGAARDAVRTAQRGGQTAVALRAAVDAVALGDPRGVETLTAITREVDCAFGRDALAAAGIR